MDNTSAVSNIAYDIEAWLDEGKSPKSIEDLIEEKKNKDEFPPNLVYIDGYFDPILGSSGCAFYDVNTGETIVGMAGTNNKNGTIEWLKDAFIDVYGIGNFGINPKSLYMYRANKFMNALKEDGYEVTGHSLGGALAVLVGLNHNIEEITTYNAAPLYVNPLFINGIIKVYRKDYKGRILQFVSEDDWLNPNADKLNAFYIGEKYILMHRKV